MKLTKFEFPAELWNWQNVNFLQNFLQKTPGHTVKREKRVKERAMSIFVTLSLSLTSIWVCHLPPTQQPTYLHPWRERELDVCVCKLSVSPSQLCLHHWSPQQNVDACISEYLCGKDINICKGIDIDTDETNIVKLLISISLPLSLVSSSVYTIWTECWLW